MARSLRSTAFKCIAIILAFLLPGVSGATEDVRCTVAAIHFDALDKSVPLETPQHARGWVEVKCSNPSSRAQEVQLGLMLAVGDYLEGGLGATHPIRVELYSDESLREALSSGPPETIDMPTRLTIDGAGESQVHIPIHARVAVRTLMEAGSYTISQDIRLVYRAITRSNGRLVRSGQ